MYLETWNKKTKQINYVILFINAEGKEDTVSLQYTEDFLRLYLQIRDIFYVPSESGEGGVTYQGMGMYDHPEECINWNKDALNLFALEGVLTDNLHKDSVTLGTMEIVKDGE